VSHPDLHRCRREHSLGCAKKPYDLPSHCGCLRHYVSMCHVLVMPNEPTCCVPMLRYDQQQCLVMSLHCDLSLSVRKLRSFQQQCVRLQNEHRLRVHQQNVRYQGVSLKCLLNWSCYLCVCCEWRCCRERMLCEWPMSGRRKSAMRLSLILK
jgi:hypothetical protein